MMEYFSILSSNYLFSKEHYIETIDKLYLNFHIYFIYMHIEYERVIHKYSKYIDKYI